MNDIKLKGPIFLIKGKDVTEILPVAYTDLEKDSKIWIGTEEEKEIGHVCGEANYKVDEISIKNLTVFITCVPYTPNKCIYDLVKNLPDDIVFIKCGSFGKETITCGELKARYVLENDNDFVLIKGKGNDRKEKMCIKSVKCNVILYRQI